MGFEGKCKPVLESIMNHHRLLVGQWPKLSSDDMRTAIVSHIAVGHCVQNPRPWNMPGTHTRFSTSSAEDNTEPISCDDFVCDTDLKQDDGVGNEIKIMNKVLEKHPSQSFLLCFLCCKDILHDPSDSCKRLRLTLSRFIQVLEKH